MSDIFGVIGVFRTQEAIRRAAVRIREAGYRAFEAYTPYPVDGLDEIVHPGGGWVPPIVMLVCAVAGAIWGYWIQYWGEVVSYPINVGGRPYNSWPAFLVSTFEFMVLAAVFGGLVALLVGSRLPRLYDPISEARSFERASRDRFVICVNAADPRFDAPQVESLLRELGAERIEEVWA
jgi:hypothetical protein